MRVARKAQAAQFAANVLPIIRDIQAAGHTSLNAIAGQLNVRKVATANGGQWRHASAADLGSGGEDGVIGRNASDSASRGCGIDAGANRKPAPREPHIVRAKQDRGQDRAIRPRH
jgi:hypothetical protein